MGGCGPAEGGYLGLSEIAQRVGMSLCVVGASSCHSFSSTASAISTMLSLRRVLLATCDPGWGAAADWQQMSWGLIWGCSSGDAA